jgi:hypothetical protein
MIHEEVTEYSEVRGNTTRMLIDVLSLLPEGIEEYPILVIAHSDHYAKDLAMRFLGLCKGHEFPNLDIPGVGTSRWFWGVNAQKEPCGHCIYVPIMSGGSFDNHTKVIFSTWSRNLVGYNFREIFIDHFAQEQEYYRKEYNSKAGTVRVHTDPIKFL